MKIFIKLLVLVLCFTQTMIAQNNKTIGKPTKEMLLKYCGEYIPSSKDKELTPMTIIFDGEYLYRHLNSGDKDQLLVPMTNTEFVYADATRQIDFVMDNKGKVLHVILTRPDGTFILKKVK
jgi:hypothetical protein